MFKKLWKWVFGDKLTLSSPTVFTPLEVFKNLVVFRFNGFTFLHAWQSGVDQRVLMAKWSAELDLFLHQHFTIKGYDTFKSIRGLYQESTVGPTLYMHTVEVVRSDKNQYGLLRSFGLELAQLDRVVKGFQSDYVVQVKRSAQHLEENKLMLDTLLRIEQTALAWRSSESGEKLRKVLSKIEFECRTALPRRD